MKFRMVCVLMVTILCRDICSASFSLFNSTATTISVGNNPSGLAVTPDGNFLYVANLSSNGVSVINTSTNVVVKTITGFDQPNTVTINPAGTKAYVTNSRFGGADAVSIIDLDPTHTSTYNTIIGTIAGFHTPYAMAITPDGLFGYVANFTTASVQRVNLTTNVIVGAPIGVGAFPSAIVITPNGNYAYVANYATGQANLDTVTVINTNSSSAAFNTVIKTISGFFGPYSLAVTPDSSAVYVTNYGNLVTSSHGSTVSVIDANPANGATFNTIIDTITVGSQPTGISINPEANYAFVTLYNGGKGGSLVTIQLGDNTVLPPSFGLGKGPVNVAVSPNGLHVYVTNYKGDSVQKLSFMNSFAVSLFNFTGTIPFFISNMYQNAYPLLETIGYIYSYPSFTSEQYSYYFDVPTVMQSGYCNASYSGMSCAKKPLHVRVFIVGFNGNNFYFDIPYAHLPIGPNSLNIDFAAVLHQIASGQAPTAELINATSTTVWTGVLFMQSTNVNYSSAA